MQGQPEADRVGFHNYHDVHSTLPPGVNNSGQAATQAGSHTIATNHTAWVYLLPFIDQGALYGEMDLNCATGPVVNSSNAGCNQGGPSGTTQRTLACGWGAGNPNVPLVSTKLAVLLCPSDDGADKLITRSDSNHYQLDKHAVSNYALTGGAHYSGWSCGAYWSTYRNTVNNLPDGRTGINVRGAFGMNSNCKFRSITDGTSNVMLVGEAMSTYSGKASQYGVDSEDRVRVWAAHRHHGTFNMTHPVIGSHCNNSRYHINGPVHVAGLPGCSATANDIRSHWNVHSSVHTGGAHALMADGTVKFLSENMDHNPYAIICRINSGEQISGDF